MPSVYIPMRNLLFICIVLLLFTSCNKNTNTADAYGNFESTEIIVSAGATGKLMIFRVEEGEMIDSGKVVGFIDTMQLHLKNEQLFAMRKASASKTGNIVAQMDVLKEQKKNLERDQ